MATIVNITTVAVTSDGEAFTTSNSGWTANTASPPYGANAPLVTNGTSPNSVYNTATSGISGMLYNSVPASSNITVRVRFKRFGAVGTPVIRCLACATAGGDDYLTARFRGDNWQIRIAKAVNGAVSTVMTDTNVTSLADTDYADMELRINNTGSPGSPNWEVSAWYGKNGAAVAQVGTTQTITDAVFDQIGRVGFTIDGVAQTTGIHITQIYAEDDTSSDPVVTSVTTTDTTAEVAWTGNATEYRIDGGTAQTLSDTTTPATLTGFTANTEYTIELRNGAGAWSPVYDFGTTNPATGGSVIEDEPLPPPGLSTSIGSIGVGVGVGITF